MAKDDWIKDIVDAAGMILLGKLIIDALNQNRCPRCNYPVAKDAPICPNCWQPLDWRRKK